MVPAWGLHGSSVSSPTTVRSRSVPAIPLLAAAASSQRLREAEDSARSLARRGWAVLRPTRVRPYFRAVFAALAGQQDQWPLSPHLGAVAAARGTTSNINIRTEQPRISAALEYAHSTTTRPSGWPVRSPPMLDGSTASRYGRTVKAELVVTADIRRYSAAHADDQQCGNDGWRGRWSTW